jgi:hypothetical protein
LVAAIADSQICVLGQVPNFTPVILAIWEAEIERIAV